MAQIPDIKTFERGMNKDLDPRFLKPGEYVHAENLINNNTLIGRAGSNTNLNGIAERSDTGLVNVASSKIIGLFEDNENNAIYIFLYSGYSVEYNRIVRYDMVNGTFNAVVLSEHLPFTTNTRIKSFDIIDGVMIWTDGESEPMTFNENIDYLAAVGYGEYDPLLSYTTGDVVYYGNILYEADATVPIGNNPPTGDIGANAYWVTLESYIGLLTEDYFTQARLAPSNNPSVNVYTDTAFVQNNINKRFFQFKYRFIFLDNQRSTFSPISAITYTKLDYIEPNNDYRSNYENAISITIEDSNVNKMIDKIEVAAREGNGGDFVSIVELDAADLLTNGSIKYNFYNNGLYKAIALEESNQIYSDTPRTAGSQRYINNKIVYGDCKTGYDKDTELDLESFSIYGDAPNPNELNYNTLVSQGGNAPRLALPLESADGLRDFFNDIGYSPSTGDVIYVAGRNNSFSDRGFGEATITIRSDWGIREIYDVLNGFLFKQLGDNEARFQDSGSETDERDGSVEYWDNEYYVFGIDQGGQHHKPTLKSGSFYDIGFQYHDSRGRTNGVINKVDGKYYIPTIGERGLTAGSRSDAGAAMLYIYINHEAPSWAEYYSIVYSRSTTSTYTITSPITEIQASPAPGGAFDDPEIQIPALATRLSLESLAVFRDENGQTDNLIYEFIKGDRVRFITKGYSAAAGVLDWVDDVYDYEIINSGTNYYGANYGGPSGNDDNFQWIDIYVPTGDITAAELISSVVEIYRPGKETDAEEVIWNETEYIYKIENGNHHGLVGQSGVGKDFSTPWKLIYDDASGDRFASIKFKDLGGFPVTSTGAPDPTYYFSIDDDDIEITVASALAYVPATTYAADDEVLYNNRTYRAFGASTGNTPSGTDSDTGFWRFLSGVYQIYDAATAYTSAAGDMVQYKGRTYLCISNTTGNLPTGLDTDNTWWEFLNRYSGDYQSQEWFRFEDTISLIIQPLESQAWLDYFLRLDRCDAYHNSTDKGLILIQSLDAYQRLRLMKTFTLNYEQVVVESRYISDFSDAIVANKGRPSAIIDQEEAQRNATLMYTEPYIPNTTINRLNIVYTDSNYEEYNKKFGAITYLHSEGDALIMFQKDKISRVLVDQSVMYDAQGGANYLGTNEKFLSRQVPFAGTYGLHSYESFVSFGNRRYFVDIERGAIMRLSNNGLEEISNNGMRGWTADLCKTMIANGDELIVGMYDPVNDAYLAFFDSYQNNKLLVFSEANNYFTTFITRFIMSHSVYINNSAFYSTLDSLYELNVSTINRNTIDNGGAVESNIQFISNIEPAELKNYLALAIDGTHALDVNIETAAIGGGSNQDSELDSAIDFTQREAEWHAPFLRDINTPKLDPDMTAGDWSDRVLFIGDTMKGKEALITLTLPAAVADEDFLLKLVKVIVSKG